MEKKLESILNWNEDLSSILEIINPDRWKVFQVLYVKRENEEQFPYLQITPKQFQYFIEVHAKYRPVAEDIELMRGSYLMLDPQCRFFQNSTGELVFSQLILDIGIIPASVEVGWDFRKFIKRGGIYKW
ncbi:MAG: hypothetical protein ACFFB5_01420 [Promethearchaeota archaeon]